MLGCASLIFSLPIRSRGDAPKNKTDPLEQHLVLIKRFVSDREDEAIGHKRQAGDLRVTETRTTGCKPAFIVGFFVRGRSGHEVRDKHGGPELMGTFCCRHFMVLIVSQSMFKTGSAKYCKLLKIKIPRSHFRPAIFQPLLQMWVGWTAQLPDFSLLPDVIYY